MKQNLKKMLSMLLALAMIISMCPGLNLTASAYDAVPVLLASETAEPVATGTCGDSLTYSVNDNGDGTYALVIEGSGAMTDYSLLSKAPWNSYIASISSVVVPDGVTNIGAYAFRNCTVLTEVTIPATVTTVGTNAFSGCEALTTVAFGGTQEQWEAITFSSGNTYLTDASITYAGGSEGEGEEVVTSEFEVSDGVLTGYTGEGGDVVIPSDLGITEINSMAFSGNTTITSLVIPEGVTSMTSQTFMNCTSLASLTLPSTLTEIPSQMSYNNALTEIVIPEGVVKIHTSAFDGCSSLTSVTLPSTLQYIYGNVFKYCSKLTTIDIPDSVIYVSNEAFTGACCIETEGNVNYVDGWALGKSAAAESFEFREGTVGLAYMAFYNNSKVTSVTLPESLKYLNDYALGDCANLVSITFKGDAPTTESVPFGEGYNTECVVYYYEGATGFTETWNKLPTVMLTEGGEEEGGEDAADNLLYGGETLTAGGEYQLASTATGIITVATTEAVTIVGNGATWDDSYTMTSTANAALGIDYTVAGADLTIKDIFATISSSASLIDFMGTGNKLTISGTNLLENENVSFNNAVIHVPAEGELTIDGEGTLYIYKSAGGTAIGGDNGETNGHIIINGGTIFAKGSKTGAVIGAGQSTIGGPITINGGNLYAMGKARGACLGGGGYTGGVVGTGGAVTINGGNVMLVVDYNGASIGGGGQNSAEEQDGGIVNITGGSLKCRINSNAYGSWGVTAGSDDETYQINDVTITADKLNGAGEAVYMLPISLEGVTANAEGDEYVVTVDGSAYYSGNGYGHTFSADTSSTVANWPAGDPENSLYLYLTGEKHTVSVNGTDTIYYWDAEAAAFTTTKPTYAWYEAGSESGEYEIDTANELAQLAAIVNGTDENYAQDNFSGKTVKLTANIALAEDGLYTKTENVTYGQSTWPMTTTQYVISADAPVWTPIGNGTATTNTNATGSAFAGTFDGAGYTVSGIYTGTTDSASANTEGLKGLFGIVTGTVKNVTVSGCITGKVVVGGVVAYLNGGTVENCVNKAIVFSDGGTTPNGNTENGTSQGGATGGIVGLAAGTGSVTGCTNNATVICANTAKGGRVGGIVGLIDQSGDAISISKCVNNGAVEGYQYVAGICGMNYAKNSPIDSCVNHGNITFNAGGKSHAGGIAGQFDCQITNCYNTGNIHSTHTASQNPRYVGGIAGDYNYSTGNGKIINCYTTGSITYAYGDCADVGIIVGESGYTINSYYLDTALENCTSDGYGVQAYDGISKTADELKADAMVGTLNGEEGTAWNIDSDVINSGYPVLAFQGGTEYVAPATYAVTIGETSNGTVTADLTEAAEGATVTLTVTPADGYELASLTVTDAEDNEVTVTDNTFVMPASDVTVSASFAVATYAISYNTTVKDFSANYTPEFYVNGAECWGDALQSVEAGANVQVAYRAVGRSENLEYNSVIVKYTLDGEEQTIDLLAEYGQSESFYFTMPAADITVVAEIQWMFELTTSAENGTVSYSTEDGSIVNGSTGTYVRPGTTVTVTATPDDGYELASIAVNGDAIEGNTFTMPASAVTVTVTFAEIPTYAWYETPNASGEYEIDTAEELAQFAAIVNGTDEIYEKDTFLGKTVKLTANIDLSTVCSADLGTWNSIGGNAQRVTLEITSQEDLNEKLYEYNIIYDDTGWSYKYGTDKNLNYDSNRTYYVVEGQIFSGTFDGNGKTISNLYVLATEGYAGLFGNVDGTLKNFTVKGSVTTATGSTECDFVGGVTGKLSEGGKIERVTSYVNVDASEKCYNVGGIAGFNGTKDATADNSFTSANNTFIIECVNYGTVYGWSQVGGITGENAGQILRCANYGSVDGKKDGSKAGIGGIAGRNGCNNVAYTAGTIIDCYNFGTIAHSANKWCGGIAGFNNAAKVGEADVELTDNGDDTYTIPGASVTDEITITVTKTAVASIEVEVNEYVKLDGKAIYLVTATYENLAEGDVLAYDGNVMSWSDTYNAYAYLVISDTELTVDAATALVTEVTATADTISYDGDVNGTGLIDINDAQLTYNMYNAEYETFDTATMAMFLRADLNGDKTLNVSDSAAVVNLIA